MTSFSAPGIPDISDVAIKAALNAIKETIEAREGLRGPDTANDRFLNLTLLEDLEVPVLKIRPSNGISGYFDDGSNFRVTIENGIITGIAASSGAGYDVE